MMDRWFYQHFIIGGVVMASEKKTTLITNGPGELDLLFSYARSQFVRFAVADGDGGEWKGGVEGKVLSFTPISTPKGLTHFREMVLYVYLGLDHFELWTIQYTLKGNTGIVKNRKEVSDDCWATGFPLLDKQLQS